MRHSACFPSSALANTTRLPTIASKRVWSLAQQCSLACNSVCTREDMRLAIIGLRVDSPWLFSALSSRYDVGKCCLRSIWLRDSYRWSSETSQFFFINPKFIPPIPRDFFLAQCWMACCNSVVVSGDCMRRIHPISYIKPIRSLCRRGTYGPRLRRLIACATLCHAESGQRQRGPQWGASADGPSAVWRAIWDRLGPRNGLACVWD